MDGVNGVDHGKGGFPDCRAIFAAVDNNGSGDIDEPTNLNVQFLWAWAMEETDYCNGGPGGFERTNKMKLLVHTLGAEEPGEPMSDPLVWDVAKFYKYEIGWNDSHAWLNRDGVVVLDQPFPSAPLVMSLRYLFLGTVHRYKAGVKNATYRNLQVFDDGGPVPSDAGASGSGGGGGSVPVDAGSGGGDAGGMDAGPSSGGNANGGNGAAGAPSRGSVAPGDSGCGCGLPRTRARRSLSPLGALALLLLARRRSRLRAQRRRSARGHRSR